MFTCPICLTEFSLQQSAARLRIAKAGPFLTCSPICGGQLRMARKRAADVRMEKAAR